MDTRAQDDKRKDMTKPWYNIAKRIAIVAAVLAGILSVLMIVNYIQTKSVDPLKSQAISQLMTRLQENSSDTALKEQIRALDLLAPLCVCACSSAGTEIHEFSAAPIAQFEQKSGAG
jgi:hypothetical protein